ncbi:hypothetical protein BGW42_004918 [Actinomortierella wolfii]|nr:hypothetical protein BGW42_004918 [Actinomortierella wolfii]
MSPKKPATNLAVLKGHIYGPPPDSVRPENHTGRPNTGIEPYSRIRITLEDVSLMDAPSVPVASQELLTGSRGLIFPIDFHIDYDPELLKDHHTYSISARVTACGGGLTGYREGVDSDDEPLTWITMTRHTVDFVHPAMTPLGSVTIHVERV